MWRRGEGRGRGREEAGGVLALLTAASSPAPPPPSLQVTRPMVSQPREAFLFTHTGMYSMHKQGRHVTKKDGRQGSALQKGVSALSQVWMLSCKAPSPSATICSPLPTVACLPQPLPPAHEGSCHQEKEAGKVMEIGKGAMPSLPYAHELYTWENGAKGAAMKCMLWC